MAKIKPNMLVALTTPNDLSSRSSSQSTTILQKKHLSFSVEQNTMNDLVDKLNDRKIDVSVEKNKFKHKNGITQFIHKV